MRSFERVESFFFFSVKRWLGDLEHFMSKSLPINPIQIRSHWTSLSADRHCSCGVTKSGNLFLLWRSQQGVTPSIYFGSLWKEFRIKKKYRMDVFSSWYEKRGVCSYQHEGKSSARRQAWRGSTNCWVVGMVRLMGWFPISFYALLCFVRSWPSFLYSFLYSSCFLLS